MTDTKNHISGAGVNSLEGRVIRPTSMAEVTEAVELAFDYRGDVTVVLQSGESVAGYLFNRHVRGPDSFVELFPSDNPAPKHIPYQAIVSIAFTGEDTASGKSWDSWVSKKESERRAETERVTADAKARGYL